MKRVKFLLSCFAVVICFKNVFGTIRENSICGRNVPCNNSQCIDRGQWCDGYKDCDDESDEMYCKEKAWYQFTRPNDCDEASYHVCDNYRCVPLVILCDGYDDCGDQSDETISYCNPAESSTMYVRETVDSELFTRTSLPTVTNQEKDEENRSTLFTSDITSTNVSSILSSRTISESSSTTENMRTRTRSAMRHGHPRFPGTPATPDASVDYYGKRLSVEESYSQHNHFVYRNNSRINVNERYDSRRPHTYRSNSDTVVDHLEPRDNKPYNSRRYTREYYEDSHSNHDSYASPTHSSGQYTNQPRTYGNSRSQNSDITSKIPKTVLPLFYFETNYTNRIGRTYRAYVERAEEWLINQRDQSYGWGEDTPRALVALSLINNSFSLNITENDLMKKHLQIHLGLKLIKNRANPMSNARLALYVNALLATCQDPRNFEGHDLVQMLYDRRIGSYHINHPNPFVYLTLCIANSSVSTREVKVIEELLESTYSDARSKDLMILAASALACFHQQHPFREELKPLSNAFSTVLSHKLRDNSFGTIYSTAIAAQALMSINLTRYWDAKDILNVIRDQQHEDGSFGDMLSTYYAIPALSGRSLLHIRNTVCDPEPVVPTEGPVGPTVPPGPRITVWMFAMTDLANVQNIQRVLDIRAGITLFDTIKILQNIDPRFNFVYKANIHDSVVDVHTIRNIPNDPERGFHWQLYESDRYDPRPQRDSLREVRQDVRRIIPQQGQSFIYWYIRTPL